MPYTEAPASGDLKQGYKGARVVDLQKRLAAAGFDPGAIDGYFGPATAAALKAFQKSAGISQTGVSDYTTWTKLTSAKPSSKEGSKPKESGGDLSDKIREEFPSLAPYLNIPEIKSLLVQASKEKWTVDRFLAEVRGTKWWQQHTLTQQEWTTLPKEEQESRIEQTASQMYSFLQSNGGFDWLQRSRYAKEFKNISSESGNKLRFWAWKVASGQMSIEQWEAELTTSLIKDTTTDIAVREMQKREEISRLRKRPEEIAEDLYREARQDFWVPLDKKTAKRWADKIIHGTFSFGEFRDEMRERARKAFPAIADRIDMGISPGEIFAPYTNMMAEELETSPEAVMLDENLFNDILAGATTGKFPSMFEIRAKVRQTPEWDRTEKARQSSFDLQRVFGQAFGVVS